MDVEGDSSEDLGRKEKRLRQSFHLLRECINNHRQNLSKNMDVEGHCGEISNGNGKHVFGNWRKGDPCHKVAENLAELCSSALWKTELTSKKLDI